MIGPRAAQHSKLGSDLVRDIRVRGGDLILQKRQRERERQFQTGPPFASRRTKVLFALTSSARGQGHFALFYFRAGESDLVSLGEVHTHFIHEGFGTEIHVYGIQPIFQK